MVEQLKKFVMQIVPIWQKMTMNQKLLTIAGIAGTLFALTMVIFLWSGVEGYAILHSDLDLEESGRIMARLDEMNVPYRMSETEPTAILVPESRARKLKMLLAMEGLPSKGYIGYELLDKTTFGMTDFLIKKNYRRALEGQLCRTLSELDNIESVSLHLSIPEPTVFVKREKPPTAAVRIQTRRNAYLTDSQVMGISHLIASSVEGLIPSNITIVDNRGVQLNKIYEDPLALLSSNQLDMKKNVESYLETRAQSMLTTALGEGNALIRVYVDLNFDRVEETSKEYGIEGTVLAEERIETTGTGDGGTSEITTTNYEVPETIRHVVSQVGNISHMSVAVVLNDPDSVWVDEDGAVRDTTLVRGPEELLAIGSLVKSAIGYNETRGDHFDITSRRFSSSQDMREQIIAERADKREFIKSIIKIAIIGVVLTASFVIMITIIRSLSRGLAETQKGEAPSKLEEQLKEMQEVESEEEVVLAKAVPYRKVQTKASNAPEETARTIKTLLKEIS